MRLGFLAITAMTWLSACAVPNNPNQQFVYSPEVARANLTTTLTSLRTNPQAAGLHFDTAHLSATINKQQPEEPVTPQAVEQALVDLFTARAQDLPKFLPEQAILVKRYTKTGDLYTMDAMVGLNAFGATFSGQSRQLTDLSFGGFSVASLVAGTIGASTNDLDPY